MSGTAFFKINSVEVNWSEDSKRKAKFCIGCGSPTFGRTDIPDATKKRGIKVEAACMGCAMRRAFAASNGKD